MDDLKYDFRIIVIDDNVEIHKDFIKILTKPIKDELEDFEEKLFEKPTNTADNLILPRFKIDTATQGKEGVALIKTAIEDKEPYALAFVDIRMPPGWDGIETIRNIWKLDSDIHVVICTAYSDYSWDETIQELGHSDNFLILKKPFDHIAVRQLAYALTRKWKLLRESRVYTLSLEQEVEKRTEELKFNATHDALTGLANRVLLQDRIQQAIATYKRYQTNFAILFFDLDRFKLINDSLGHSAGDELLNMLAQRLLTVVRSFDTLSRLGGDEFVLLITELNNVSDITKVANKVLGLIKEPWQIKGHTLGVTSSIGVSICPQDGQEVGNLLRNADMAMYQAKKLGGDQFQFYSSEMNEDLLEQLELEAQLYQALIKKELVLWYQPQFHIQENKLEAVEALIRWRHPSKGLLLPLNFIPIAERTGLIIPISDWVLKEACIQSKAWQEEGLAPIRMAVNITSQQLNQIDFVEKIKSTLTEVNLEPQYLELEITESAIINPSIIDKINELKIFGIQIALDDFGTGYSNLHHLRTMALNRLKIDRSFINNIQCNGNDELIIQAIISMAKSLKLDVLAEGVETQKQLDFLKGYRCDQIQGFYFSKPLPAAKLTQLLKNPDAISDILKQVRME